MFCKQWVQYQSSALLKTVRTHLGTLSCAPDPVTTQAVAVYAGNTGEARIIGSLSLNP